MRKPLLSLGLAIFVLFSSLAQAQIRFSWDLTNLTSQDDLKKIDLINSTAIIDYSRNQTSSLQPTCQYEGNGTVEGWTQQFGAVTTKTGYNMGTPYVIQIGANGTADSGIICNLGGNELGRIMGVFLQYGGEKALGAAGNLADGSALASGCTNVIQWGFNGITAKNYTFDPTCAGQIGRPITYTNTTSSWIYLEIDNAGKTTIMNFSDYIYFSGTVDSEDDYSFSSAASGANSATTYAQSIYVFGGNPPINPGHDMVQFNPITLNSSQGTVIALTYRSKEPGNNKIVSYSFDGATWTNFSNGNGTAIDTGVNALIYIRLYGYNLTAFEMASAGGEEPPTITSYLDQGSSCAYWNSDTLNPCTTSDTTPSLYFNTSINAYCRIGKTNENYTAMTSSRNCDAGEGSKEHMCDLKPMDELTEEHSFLHISCRSESGFENRSSTSGPLALNIPALDFESVGRAAIESGAQIVLASEYSVYTNQKLYARNSANNQFVGQFDKVIKYLNKIWAFNILTGNDTSVGGFNITPTLYILEFRNSTPTYINNTVQQFINSTR